MGFYPDSILKACRNYPKRLGWNFNRSTIQKSLGVFEKRGLIERYKRFPRRARNKTPIQAFQLSLAGIWRGLQDATPEEASKICENCSRNYSQTLFVLRWWDRFCKAGVDALALKLVKAVDLSAFRPTAGYHSLKERGETELAKNLYRIELDWYTTTNFFAAIFPPTTPLFKDEIELDGYVTANFTAVIPPTTPLSKDEMERWDAYLLGDGQVGKAAGGVFYALEFRAHDEASKWKSIKEHLSTSSWKPEIVEDPETQASHPLLDKDRRGIENTGPEMTASDPMQVKIFDQRRRRGKGDAFEGLRRQGKVIEAQRRRKIIAEDERDRNRPNPPA